MIPQPRAVKYAWLFCLFMVVVNLALAYSAFWASSHVDWMMMRIDPEIPTDLPEYKIMAETLRKTLLSMVVSSFVFAPLNLWLAFAKPSVATFFLHAGNFLASAASCICAPVAIPMLIAWMKPDVQQYFGVKPRNTGQ